MSSGADGDLGSVVSAFLVGEHDPPYLRGDTSLQTANRFVPGLAFSDPFVEVSPPRTVGPPDLRDCYKVRGRIQLTIAAS